ncbi:hypothetical protein [Salinarchaeum laminariae]|uniref:hypothetical protein n=1 Tax=Salinarchaeum laminariae TaxID=869888 RepID=UPI0020C0091F|nr:hypothetical protein [Salinarchaeum laminariae]
MNDSRQRDVLYMLFAIQSVVVGATITADWGPLLEIVGILVSVILFLRECARTLAEAFYSTR